MAKGVIILLFMLGIIAALLVGINIGKKICNPDSSLPQPTVNIQPSTTTPPTIIITPTPEVSSSATLSATPVKKTAGTSTFTDRTCGVSFSYPGSYMKQTSVNNQSTIFTDPDNPDTAIAVACATTIPRPPISSDKIEAITVANIAATLYHDKNPNGDPRDEVIVKNPYNDMEVIIAGYGPTYQTILRNIRFVQ